MFAKNISNGKVPLIWMQLKYIFIIYIPLFCLEGSGCLQTILPYNY